MPISSAGTRFSAPADWRRPRRTLPASSTGASVAQITGGLEITSTPRGPISSEPLSPHFEITFRQLLADESPYTVGCGFPGAKVLGLRLAVGANASEMDCDLSPALTDLPKLVRAPSNELKAPHQRDVSSGPIRPTIRRPVL